MAGSGSSGGSSIRSTPDDQSATRNAPARDEQIGNGSRDLSQPKRPRPLPGRWVDAWTSGSELERGVRHVLHALSNYMDQRGVAWPSVSTLAGDTRYTRRQVFTCLNAAQKAGWLV